MLPVYLTIWSLLLLPGAHAADLITRLPTEQFGWLGADAAYSHIASHEKRIWLFGDSLLGETGKGIRKGIIVRNSVAVEKNGKFQYFFGRRNVGIFVNQRIDEWYWPGDFLLYDAKLYIFLRRIKKANGTHGFGFQQVGTDLAVIENPSEQPDFWKMKITTLASENINLGVAVAAQSDYLLTLVDNQKLEHSLVLARIPLLELEKSVPKFEFYRASQGKWQSEYIDDPIIKNGAPEASLVFVQAQLSWRVVLTPMGISPHVLLYKSQKLVGPWKLSEEVFSCPEQLKSSKYFCYAAKEVETVGENLVFTYSVNSTDFQDLARDPTIYIPRIVNTKKQ